MLYFSANIIIIIKSKRIGCAGHAARMEQRWLHIGLSWGSQKEGDYWEYLDVYGRIILKWILEKYDGVVWTGFIWLRLWTRGELL
jgi:hypothetical protein